MHRLAPVALVATLTASALLVACGGDDAPRRSIPVAIDPADTGCTPASIGLKTGEKVTFAVKNDGKKDWEFEGIEGTKIEEVLVPSGRSRNIDYTASSSPGTAKVKCYTPAGANTVIELAIAQ